MARPINPKQMEAWINKLQSNMQKFLQDDNLNPDDRLTFIRQQYALFEVINKVLNGKAHFTGCPQPDHH